MPKECTQRTHVNLWGRYGSQLTTLDWTNTAHSWLLRFFVEFYSVMVRNSFVKTVTPIGRFSAFQGEKMSAAGSNPNLSQDVWIEELDDSLELKQVSIRSKSHFTGFSFGRALEGPQVVRSKVGLSDSIRLARWDKPPEDHHELLVVMLQWNQIQSFRKTRRKQHTI